MPDARLVTVGDIAEIIAMGPFGSNIKVETFQSDGIPIISGAHLHGVRLHDGDYNFVSVEHADRLGRSNVKRGDVIFTHAGNIGQVAYIPESSRYDRYIISQRQFYLRCSDAADPRYMAYYFRSPAGRHALLANASQVGVPSIARPASYLRSIQLVLPGKSEQVAIADTLSMLDDKIELNRRMNETLEAMAQAIFRDWFVDFGPVRRRMEGATDPVAIMGGLTPDPEGAAALAGLFDQPAAPCKPLSEVARVEWGNTSLTKASYEPTGHPAYSAAGPDGLIPEAERSGVATVVSAIGTVGKLYLAHGQWTAIKNTLTVQAKAPIARLYTHFALREVPIPARGSTQQFIALGDLRALPVPVADESQIAAFDAIVAPLFQAVWCREAENQTLVEIRDYLLPRLMSGQVRVGDALEQVSEAAA